MFKIPKMRGLYDRIWLRVHRASHAQAALQRPVVAGPPSSMVESPGARSFTKAGVEPASSASAATASRMGTETTAASSPDCVRL